MGCSASVARMTKFKRRTESLNNYVEYITAEEKRLILKTWNRLSRDIPRVGVKIFLRIFVLNPDLKQIFPFRDCNGAELLQDPVFKGHASRFMQAVGAAIDNMDDLNNAMGPMLVGLGGQHINYAGFKPEYWDIFIESVTDIWKQELRRKFSSKVSEAWHILFEFMVSKLKEGYEKALCEASSRNHHKVSDEPV